MDMTIKKTQNKQPNKTKENIKNKKWQKSNKNKTKNETNLNQNIVPSFVSRFFNSVVKTSTSCEVGSFSGGLFAFSGEYLFWVGFSSGNENIMSICPCHTNVLPEFK